MLSKNYEGKVGEKVLTDRDARATATEEAAQAANKAATEAAEQAAIESGEITAEELGINETPPFGGFPASLPDSV